MNYLYLDRKVQPSSIYKINDFTRYWLQLELPQKEKLLSGILHFRKFGTNLDKPRIEEIYLEFLIMGTFLSTFLSRAKSTNPFYLMLLKTLSFIPGRYRFIRVWKQKITRYLKHSSVELLKDTKNVEPKDLKRLLLWMEVQDGFRFEVECIRNWKKYLDNIEYKKASSIIDISMLTAISFFEMIHRISNDTLIEENMDITLDNDTSTEPTTFSNDEGLAVKYLNLFIVEVFKLVHGNNRPAILTWAM